MDRRLRLVRRPDTPVARHADAVEAAFAAHHIQLVASLDELERDLDDVESESGRGAHEQVSFIRVGLRCLADAIGELHAHIADLPASEPGDRPPKRPGGNAA